MILHLLHANLLFLLCQPLLIGDLTAPLFFQGAFFLPAKAIHLSQSFYQKTPKPLVIRASKISQTIWRQT